MSESDRAELRPRRNKLSRPETVGVISHFPRGDRDSAATVLLDRDQRAAVAVDIAGPQTQALPDAIPRCQHLRTRDLADHIAAPRQHDAAFDGDADLKRRSAITNKPKQTCTRRCGLVPATRRSV